MLLSPPFPVLFLAHWMDGPIPPPLGKIVPFASSPSTVPATTFLQVHVELLLMLVVLRRGVTGGRRLLLAHRQRRQWLRQVVGPAVRAATGSQQTERNVVRRSAGQRRVLQVHQEGPLVHDASTSGSGRVQGATGGRGVQIRQFRGVMDEDPLRGDGLRDRGASLACDR